MTAALVYLHQLGLLPRWAFHSSEDRQTPLGLEPAHGGKAAQEACAPLPGASLSVQRQEQTLLPVVEQGTWELTEVGDVRASIPREDLPLSLRTTLWAWGWEEVVTILLHQFLLETLAEKAECRGLLGVGTFVFNVC